LRSADAVGFAYLKSNWDAEVGFLIAVRGQELACSEKGKVKPMVDVCHIFGTTCL